MPQRRWQKGDILRDDDDWTDLIALINNSVQIDDPRLSVVGGGISTDDPRLSDARVPLIHVHLNTEITGTAVLTNDSRLSDARVPSTHSHSASDITGTAVLTNDARLSDARIPLTHDHDAAYEAKNSNIQTHVTAAHAPANAQANADITKAEIEVKLIGAISTHSHAGGSDPFLVKLRLAGDITNATVTPTNLTGMAFTYEVNSFYVFEMFILCTSGAATTGYGFALDVSSAVTSVGLNFTHQLATGGTLSGGDSIADNVSRGLSSGVPAITVINPVMGHGILVTGANTGTAQFTFRPEVAYTATVKAGSIIRVMKIT